jgi:hypothetical protein
MRAAVVARMIPYIVLDGIDPKAFVSFDGE